LPRSGNAVPRGRVDQPIKPAASARVPGESVGMRRAKSVAAASRATVGNHAQQQQQQQQQRQAVTTKTLPPLCVAKKSTVYTERYFSNFSPSSSFILPRRGDSRPAILLVASCVCNFSSIDPLEFRGNYSATSNNMKFVHWPLMLHLV